MNNLLTIDIETILPDEEYNKLKIQYAMEYSSIAKSKFTAEEYINDKMQSAYVDINIIKPILISMYADYMVQPIVLFNDNVEDLMMEFIKTLEVVYGKMNYNVILAGFNISEFDLPCLARQMIKYKIFPSKPIFPIKSWNYKELRDIYKKGSLDLITKSLNLKTKYNGYTGADVARLYKEGKIDELIAYSKQDAVIEHQLATLTYLIYY